MARIRALSAIGGGGGNVNLYYEINDGGSAVTKTVDPDKLVFALNMHFTLTTYTKAMYRDSNDTLQTVGNSQNLLYLTGTTLTFAAIASGNRIIAWAESV